MATPEPNLKAPPEPKKTAAAIGDALQPAPETVWLHEFIDTVSGLNAPVLLKLFARQCEGTGLHTDTSARWQARLTQFLTSPIEE